MICLKVVLDGLNFPVGRIAVAGSDYVGRSNVLLTFNADTTSIEVPVNITDDSVYEGDEDFSGILTLFSTSPRVSIGPATALATIVENDDSTSIHAYTCIV